MSLDGREGLMTAPAVDPEPPFPDMVWVPGKTYLMGSDRHYPGGASGAPRLGRRVLDGPAAR